MFEIVTSDLFDRWFEGLKDRKGKMIVLARLRRMSLGQFGDAKPVGSGISELRIDFGPGYRLYFMQRGQIMVIVLAGGDKSTQARDIKTAQLAAAEWRD